MLPGSMEVTNDASIRYLVADSRQRGRLEEAVKAFPGRIELSDFTTSGDGPALIVTEGRQGEVVVRPYRCSIRRVTYCEGIPGSVAATPGLHCAFSAGRSYTILNTPLCGNSWD